MNYFACFILLIKLQDFIKFKFSQFSYFLFAFNLLFWTCTFPYIPALINVVNSQGAQTEDEENSYEHVVDGPDVTNLKQFTDGQKNKNKKSKQFFSLNSAFYTQYCI